MTDINRCLFTGRVGNEPELRTTLTGVSTCVFDIAVERAKQKDAEKAEIDWLTMVAWRSTAEFCSRYLSKGMKVTVEASARTRKWEDKTGKTHKTFEFHVSNVIPVFFREQDAASAVAQSSTEQSSEDFIEIGQDEDLPF